MENNELMNVEEVEVMDDVVVTEEKSGIGTGLAMIIGAAVALAASAGVKAAKKGIAKLKAKRAAKKSEGEAQVEDDDIEEIEEV